MKYTPHPWDYDQSDDTFYTSDRLDAHEVLHHPDPEVAAGNRRLIENAALMYEALRAVEYCISGYDGVDGSSSQLCPICGYTPLDGHADDCIIGSTLKPYGQEDDE
jgi:hypothetical protein